MIQIEGPGWSTLELRHLVLDPVVSCTEDALDLLLHLQRMIATLRR